MPTPPPMSALALAALLLGACGEGPAPVAPPAPADRTTGGNALLIGAGDIADCSEGGANARATAALIAKALAEDAGAGRAAVFTLGDNAYGNGTEEEFRDCYDKVWGGFKGLTRPAPGNHDYGIYLTPPRNDAAPYFAYFGANAGTPGKGFYSYDLGSWHIVSLDSMASGERSAEQLAWLDRDLGATEKPCILAYWHHPLWSSGPHGQQADDPGRRTGPLWVTLRRHHADVVLNGHDHDYERFALQDENGKADPQGIREFVVGTGGGELYSIVNVHPNSEAQDTHFGVLALTLRPDGYEWQFRSIAGDVGDRSTAPQACHPD